MRTVFKETDESGKLIRAIRRRQKLFGNVMRKNKLENFVTIDKFHVRRVKGRPIDKYMDIMFA